MRALPSLFLCAALLAASPALAAAPKPEAVARKEAGDKLRDAGDVAGARAAYQEAVSLSPGYAAALNELGSLAFAAGEIPAAVAKFKEAIAADRSYALAYYNLGYASRKAGAYDAAAEAYGRYVALKPEDPDGYYGLAESHAARGDRPNAIAAYEQYARRERRESEKPYVEKALAKAAELKKLEEASRGSVGPPKVPPGGDPQLALRKMAEGDQWIKQGKHREALFAYQDAVAANPKSPDALFRLGLAYAFLGYYPEAIQRWRTVLDDPKASEELKSRARTNLHKPPANRGARAAAPAGGGGTGAAAAAAGGAARGHYEKGNELFGARQYGPAVEAYSKAIEVKGDYAFAYVGRGNARIGLGKLAEAKADLEKAHELAPTAASPLYGLAVVHERLGDPAKAKTFYRLYAASTAPDASASLKAAAEKKAAAP